MATYAIGDVHGCYKSLQQLLQEISFNPQQDKLWFAGDLVNRGKYSLDVLRLVADLGSSSLVVLGNHDLHLLAIHAGKRKERSSDTLSKVLKASDVDELCAWLRQQPLLHQDKELGYTLTHAGIPPAWGLKRARKLAAEVEKHLRDSERYKKFLNKMYGDDPSVWTPALKGSARRRLITNYFTRMRFCMPDSTLEFRSKHEANKAPKGFKPWYAYPSKAGKNSQLLFGHWAALNGKTKTEGFHCLDTGCVWGGKLTAMRLEDGEKFSVKAAKEDLV